MRKLALVFAAKIDNASSLFNGFLHIPYDIIFLCSKKKEKILKKDIDYNLEELNKYDIICPVGAEPLKYICGLTGITKYNGFFIEKRYIPLINPTLVEFRPQYAQDIKKACELVAKVVLDTTVETKREIKDYDHITTDEDFCVFIEELKEANYIVVDIETTSLSPRRGNVICIGFSTRPHQGVVIDSSLIHKYKNELNELFLNKLCVFHNAKFDIQYLEYEFGFRFPLFEDTMLMHYCLDEAVGTHGLKALALKFTDLGDYEEELLIYKKTFCRKNKILLEDFNYGMLPLEVLIPYTQKDADGTAQLYEKFKPLIDNNEKFVQLYNGMLKPYTEALVKLEKNGGPIDLNHLNHIINDYTIDIEETINEIKSHPDVQRFERLNKKDFNPNSTYHLRDLFFNILRFNPIKYTETERESVDAEVLAEIDHPLAEAILDLRQKSKMVGTYLNNIKDGVDVDLRLRSSFNITGTTSGRLSSSGTLNYQNLPRDDKNIKRIFRARPGYKIVQCDLGTAEVYVAAVLADDKFLQKAFVSGLDFHSYIAKQIFNLDCEVHEVKEKYKNHRQWAKSITFGIMYLATATKIASEANVSYEQAKSFIKKYFTEAFGLKGLIDSKTSFIKDNAYIYSIFNRKRRLPEVKSPNKGIANHAIRSGINFLVQSVASDINLLGLVDLFKWIEENKLENEIIPFTVVHDSIVSEVKEEYVEQYIEMTKKFLQTDRGCFIENCPIKVDFNIGNTWGDLED